MEFLQAISRALPWEEEAACRGDYAGKTRGTWIIEPSAELASPHSVAPKLETCDSCPVRADCLSYALSADFTAIGIWGGTTTVERTTLAPRVHESLGSDGERRRQIERANEILTKTHAERLDRWRGFAQEARKAQQRGKAFRVARERVTEPLRRCERDVAGADPTLQL